jgi:membrane protein CcdC involved in cytochrome C biogenesis
VFICQGNPVLKTVFFLNHILRIVLVCSKHFNQLTLKPVYISNWQLNSYVFNSSWYEFYKNIHGYWLEAFSVLLLFSFQLLCKPVLESMFSLFYIKNPIIYITILMGVVLVRTAPTAFHNYVVDDSAWISFDKAFRWG